jgi:hypothetical protein
MSSSPNLHALTTVKNSISADKISPGDFNYKRLSPEDGDLTVSRREREIKRQLERNNFSTKTCSLKTSGTLKCATGASETSQTDAADA